MKRLLVNLLFVFGILIPMFGQVKFNEVQTSNSKTQMDPDYFKYKDWVELYNTSSSSFDLSGCYITDNKDKPRKWQIPSGQSIGAGKYLIIYCDGEDVTGAAMHTNFKLSSEGDKLFLYSSTMLLLDSVNVGLVETDYTWGRLTNGTGAWAALSRPTPGASNVNTTVKGIAPRPIFSITGGYYNKEQSVTLSTNLPGAVIRYTTDGSEPTKDSPIYTGAITAKSSTKTTQKYGYDRKNKTGIQHYGYPSTLDYPSQKYTGTRTYGFVLKAKVFHDDYVPSVTECNTYFININKRSLPVVAVSTDFANFFDTETGIYIQGTNGLNDGYVTANWRQDWERKVYVEYFDGSGNRQFGVNAGATTMGAVSRNYDMKSLNVEIKSKYDDRLIQYPLFGSDGLQTYQSFVLRNAGNDWEQGSKYRDAAIQQVLRGQVDLETQDFEPVVMYLNGEYWGLINLRERFDDHYFEGYYDYADDIDLLKYCDDSIYNFRASKGTTERMKEMMVYLENNSMANQENYEYVKSHYIDVDNMITYYIAQLYCQNTDWPTNNMRMWRPRTENGKFRFPWYDTDFGYGLWGGEAYTNPWDNFDKSGYKKKTSVALLNYMLENDEFKAEFVQRFYAMMATVYDPNRFIEISDNIESTIKSERTALMDEWTCYLNDGDCWGYGKCTMQKFASERVSKMQGYVNDKFGAKGTTRLNIKYTNTQGSVYVCSIPVANDYSAKHQKDRPIRLTAEPKDGYKFKCWKNGNTTVSTNPEYFVTITSETTITAEFETRSTETKLHINEFLTSNSTDIVDEAGQNEDWIEIYNASSSPIDLAGLYLSDTSANLTQYQIPYGHADETTIDGNGFLILWADNDTQDGPLHLPFKLDRSGGNIYLSQKSSSGTVTTIDHISYSQQNTDVSFGRYQDGTDNLIIFTKTTPGESNTILSESFVDGLVINEFMTKNKSIIREETGTYADWFEIYNTTNKDIDLGGLFVTNDLTNLNKYMIPKGEPTKTTVKAGGYYVFWCDKQTAINPNHVDFKLPAEKGDIAIVQLRGSENYIIDQVSYSNQGQDIAYGRYPNGTGDFRYLLTPTANAANTTSGSVVAVSGITINEVLALNTSIVADESGVYSDFIEFYNGTNAAIDLGGLFISDSAGYSLRCRIPTNNSAATTVQSGKWITFWADGKPELGANHLDFSLDGEHGEDVILSQITASGEIVTLDQISFGPQTENISYGRFPELADYWEEMSPTYSSKNQSVNSSVALKSLTASIGTILPAVSTSVLTYECSVPAGTTSAPTISATTVNAKASVTITQAQSLTDMAIVKVISANGYNSETYKVSFKIAASSDAALATLELGGGTLKPAFNPEITEYEADLSTTYVPYLTAIANDVNAMVVVEYAPTLSDVTTITVTAEDGSTRQYSISYVATSSQNIVTEWADNFENGIGNLSTNNSVHIIKEHNESPKNKNVAVALNEKKEDTEFGYVEYHLPTGYMLDGSKALNVTMDMSVPNEGADVNGVKVSNQYMNFNVAVVDMYGNVSDYLNNNTTVNTGTNQFSVNFSTASYVTKSAIVAIRFALYGPDDTPKERKKALYMDNLVIGPKTATGQSEAVVLSDNAELASLSVSAGTMSPTFSDATKEYTVVLPAGTEIIPTISATAVDEHAYLEVTQASNLNGKGYVKVISQDLITVNEFSVQFILTPQVVDAYTDYVVRPAMAGWSENSSLYDLAYNGGDMAVTYNRSSALSDAITYNIVDEDYKILDLSETPYVSVKMKSTVATSLFVELFDEDGKTTATSVAAASVPSGSEMKTYIFDFTGKFGNADMSNIYGMKLYFDKGSSTQSSGTIKIDELRFGKDVEISINQAPVWTEIASQTIQQGEDFTNINLTNFVTDDNTAATDLVYELENASENLTIAINSGILSVAVKDADWIGSESIKISATDEDGASSVVMIDFTVEELKIDLTSVSFSQSSVTITQGATENLASYLSLEPANATIESIEWSISDNSIASINGAGVLSNMLDYGSENVVATVVVTDKSGNEYTKTITAILMGCAKAVSLVSVDNSTMDLFYEETALVDYSLTPSDACVKQVSYTSSDLSVATVSETGLITALSKKGSAVITISVNDGFSVKTATITVNVSKDCSGDIELNLNKSSLALVLNGYETLTATITPNNECTADNVVLWSSSNTSVATVSNGIVNAVGVGSTTITATTTGNGKTTATCVVEVSSDCEDGLLEVAMNSNEEQLYLSSSLTLSANIMTANPCDSEILWSSSDETVATVVDGVVTPKKYGTATIRATARQNENSYDECMVTVAEKEVTSVEISASAKMLYVGSTSTLTASVFPDDADDKTITWSTSNADVATVTQKGVVTGISSGTVKIFAFAESGVSDYYTLTVVNVEVQDITLNVSEITLTIDDAQQINATFAPENATIKTLTYESLDESVATVSEDGIITAIAEGSTSIIVTTANSISKVISVIVKSDVIPVESVAVAPKSIEMYIDDTQSIVATVTPDNATNKAISWSSSDNTVATVSATGSVTAVGVGTAEITASSANGKTASTTVEVSYRKLTSVSFTSKSIALTEGKSTDLSKLLVLNPTAVETKSIEWSSSSDNAIVDEDGLLVNNLSYGTENAIVTVSVTDQYGTVKTATIDVTLTGCETQISSIAVNPTTVEIVKSATTQLAVTITPANACVESTTYTSADVSKATVSANGKITPIAEGSTTITIVVSDGYNTYQKEVAVTILKDVIAVTDVEFDTPSYIKYIGDKFQLSPTVSPLDATTKTLTWSSSNPAVATVDNNGNVEILKTGTVSITATANNGVSATCVITAKTIDVTSVFLSQTEMEMFVYDKEQLIAMVSPANATDNTIIWASSNESIASVDDNGNVEAKKSGSCNISATAKNGKTKSCLVTVYDIEPTSISISPTTIKMNIGETRKVDVTLQPSNVTDTTIIWQSAYPAIAKVVNGEITAVSAGTTTITARTTSGLSQSLTVTVNPLLAESISLNTEEATLLENEQQVLVATILPTKTTDKSVTWVSSNPSIVSVDTKGKLTANSIGDAVITATTANGLEATCIVHVTLNVVAVSDVMVEPETITMYIGDIESLSAIVSPSNATNKSLVWTTSRSSVATVDQYGTISAIAKGTATITATSSNNISGTCVVTVNAVEVESITLSDVSLAVGESQTLQAVVAPTNATNKTITWSIDDESIATINSSSGKITGVSKGTAIVTAKALNGVTTTAKVTVAETAIEVQYVSPKTNIVYINIDAVEDLTSQVQFFPENATNKALKWEIVKSTPTYETGNVVSLSNTGSVTGLLAGTAVVKFTSVSSSSSGTLSIIVSPMLATGIELNKQKLELLVDEQEKLIATVTPDKTSNKSVTWKSSNEAVALVSSKGTISAISVGTAIITATTADKSNLSATCEVIVAEEGVTSITPSLSSLTLKYGFSKEITLTIEPAEASASLITWKSNNPSVVTVDDTGYLTAVGYGTAIITATASNGVSCQIVVTVPDNNKAPVLLEKIPDQTINAGESFTSINLNDYFIDDKTTNLKWSIDAGGSNISISVDGSGIASISVVDPKWSGSQIVTIYATDGDGAKTSAQLVLTVNGSSTPEPPEAIESIVVNEMLVYPNPTNGPITISFETITEEVAKIEIYTSQGRKVYAESVVVNGEFAKTLYLNDFVKGVYVVEVTIGSEKKSIQVILN